MIRFTQKPTHIVCIRPATGIAPGINSRSWYPVERNAGFSDGHQAGTMHLEVERCSELRNLRGIPEGFSSERRKFDELNRLLQIDLIDCIVPAKAGSQPVDFRVLNETSSSPHPNAAPTSHEPAYPASPD